MKKQLLSFVALLCVVWLTPTRAAAYNFMVGGINYNITSSSNPLTVEVTNNRNYDGVYAGTITIPEQVTYNNVTYSVTRIGGECKRFDRPRIQNHRPSWRGGTAGGQVRQGHDSHAENGIGI